MRGVSAIIAIILILMIVISLVAMAYMFYAGIFTTTTSAATQSLNTSTKNLLSNMKIEGASENIIYIRNIGQTDLSEISVYINDEPVNFVLSPLVVKPGDTGKINVTDFVANRNINLVITTKGFTTTKKFNNMLFCSDINVSLCLTFDEGSGNIVYDHSPYGNAGTVGNPIWITGKIGGALDFPTSGFNIPNSASLSITKTITIMAWVYPRSVGGGFVGLTGYNPTWGYSFVWWGDGRVSLRFQNSTGSWLGPVTTNPALTTSHLNSWHHVAVTYDLANVRYYIDGNLVETVPLTYTPGPSANLVGIGNAGWSSLDGLMDEVRIFNKVLTIDEIAEVFRGV